MLNMQKRIFPLICFLMIASLGVAQQFVAPAHAFSHKKTAYITLEDGTELTGTLKKVDRKKGLIEEIKIELSTGKKEKINPEDIKFAYFPPSGLDKLSRRMDFMSDATQWNSNGVDQNLVTEGLAYFEKTEVKIKKKTQTLLLQLMNPHFSSRVKVFHDPFAKETASVGVAGVKMAGGLDKSYYLKVGDDVAYKVKKKDYDEEFKTVFAGCDAVLNHEDASKWSQFEKLVALYAEQCGDKS